MDCEAHSALESTGVDLRSLYAQLYMLGLLGLFPWYSVPDRASASHLHPQKAGILGACRIFYGLFFLEKHWMETKIKLEPQRDKTQSIVSVNKERQEFILG